jgi:hypothetical protein
MAPEIPQITALSDEGLSTEEIAAAIGTNRAQVVRLARRYGVRLARCGLRRVASELPPRRYALLKAIAAHAQVSPATMAARVIGLVVEDGAALRRLGRLAEPKRAYRRREAS